MTDCDLFLADFNSVARDFQVNSIITDIPFNVSRDNNFKTMKDRTGRNGIHFGSWDENFSLENLRGFYDLVKEGGSVLIFMAFEQYAEVKRILELQGFETKDRLVFRKTNPMPRNRERRYVSDIEFLAWFTKGSGWVFNRQYESYDSSLMEYPAESGGGFVRYHPTQKPLKLMRELILRHTNKDDIVLDPFMGSGSTGVACKELQRNFMGFEIDQKYYNTAKKRCELIQEVLCN